MDDKRLWELAGECTGGTVIGLACSPETSRDGTIFAATLVGLFRSQNGGQSWQKVGDRLPGPFLSAVGVSPDFAHDRTVLVASMEGGLFRSVDGGHTWLPGDLGGQGVNISALAISQDFHRGGRAFAGTLGSGIFFSRDQGATWELCNFGLLDLNVLDLAISPAFSQDETIFAATTSGVFRSQNGGRAWREVDFPVEAAPVQCLACSPGFSEDGTVFAGTEAAGIFRSSDRGATWQPLDGPRDDKCINALALSPDFTGVPSSPGSPGNEPTSQTVLAATDRNLYVSRDGGERWSHSATMPGALCLALAPTFPSGGPTLAGFTAGGIYRSTDDLASWHPANEGLPARVLAGMALSPQLAVDHQILVFGPGEGVIRSTDGGLTWAQIGTGLPSRDIHDLVIARTANGEIDLYAALAQGVWKGDQGGTRWEQVSDLPAQRLVLSPHFPQDSTLIVGAKNQGLWVSRDGGGRWQPIDAPWKRQDVLAMALSPAFPDHDHVLVILSGADGGGAEVWRGGIDTPWARVSLHPAGQGHDGPGPARSAALAVPPTYPHDGNWYAAIGDQCYGSPQADTPASGGDRSLALTGQVLAPEHPTVIDLAVAPGQTTELLAATDLGIYRSPGGGEAWQHLSDGLPARPMVAIVPDPDSPGEGAIYALELGGNLWRMRSP